MIFLDFYDGRPYAQPAGLLLDLLSSILLGLLHPISRPGWGYDSLRMLSRSVCSPQIIKSTGIRLISTDSKLSYQGYMDNYCFHAGSCGERDCPSFCLCLEASLCVGPSMSSSRISMMDQYRLRPDPCDNRIIRLTNCLQILSWYDSTFCVLY
jgi:hypothetical protein